MAAAGSGKGCERVRHCTVLEKCWGCVAKDQLQTLHQGMPVRVSQDRIDKEHGAEYSCEY